MRANLKMKKQTLKGPIPEPREGKSFGEGTAINLNHTAKTVWMADFKKAGERAEYLWSKIYKKGAYANGG
jgi:hypothetical protein